MENMAEGRILSKNKRQVAEAHRNNRAKKPRNRRGLAASKYKEDGPDTDGEEEAVGTELERNATSHVHADESIRSSQERVDNKSSTQEGSKPTETKQDKEHDDSSILRGTKRDYASHSDERNKPSSVEVDSKVTSNTESAFVTQSLAHVDTDDRLVPDDDNESSQARKRRKTSTSRTSTLTPKAEEQSDPSPVHALPSIGQGDDSVDDGSTSTTESSKLRAATPSQAKAQPFSASHQVLGAVANGAPLAATSKTTNNPAGNGAGAHIPPSTPFAPALPAGLLQMPALALPAVLIDAAIQSALRFFAGITGAVVFTYIQCKESVGEVALEHKTREEERLLAQQRAEEQYLLVQKQHHDEYRLQAQRRKEEQLEAQRLGEYEHDEELHGEERRRKERRAEQRKRVARLPLRSNVQPNNVNFKTPRTLIAGNIIPTRPAKQPWITIPYNSLSSRYTYASPKAFGRTLSTIRLPLRTPSRVSRPSIPKVIDYPRPVPPPAPFIPPFVDERVDLRFPIPTYEQIFEFYVPFGMKYYGKSFDQLRQIFLECALSEFSGIPQKVEPEQQFEMNKQLYRRLFANVSIVDTQMPQQHHIQYKLAELAEQAEQAAIQEQQTENDRKYFKYAATKSEDLEMMEVVEPEYRQIETAEAPQDDIDMIGEAYSAAATPGTTGFTQQPVSVGIPNQDLTSIGQKEGTPCSSYEQRTNPHDNQIAWSGSTNSSLPGSSSSTVPFAQGGQLDSLKSHDGFQLKSSDTFVFSSNSGQKLNKGSSIDNGASNFASNPANANEMYTFGHSLQQSTFNYPPRSFNLGQMASSAQLADGDDTSMDDTGGNSSREGSSEISELTEFTENEEDAGTSGESVGEDESEEEQGEGESDQPIGSGHPVRILEDNYDEEDEDEDDDEDNIDIITEAK